MGAAADPSAGGWPAEVGLDAGLRRLARQEAACRLLLGRLARPFRRRRLHQELGFARLGDWSRERLGLSAREVQSLAHVAERLEGLPQVRAAFVAGELSWSQARLLAERATPEDEGVRVAFARGRSLRVLDHHLVFRSRGGHHERENRVAICAWHHLRGIHAGRVRAWGTAPDHVHWELGVRGGRAFLRFEGERYVA